ncbi:hypothetical protein DCAR_0205423 [Daucus carota subsp. sativus]|uniref:Reverse transcriptase domain-containing protein n=1 Tax=Daucus carota subsp. sativus TaxID=79200 RepID=A0AAF1AMQ9_DAUCS|nr:PREDICTED: uncharacterized protein LOC108207066 [Daucus carota subsp. sativus]WOG86222.1 hypothetical protein DCAR_0205423 [Daucus carota subsp. sativus]
MVCELAPITKLPLGSNSSFIALIPKSINAVHPSDFRPISLMNALVKLLSKVLATRLKSFMPLLISHNQTAFIKGRQISDGILITSEIVSLLQKQNLSGSIFKIDFEKAFDRVRWDFVLDVLSALNFGAKWISWVKSIFYSSRISVLVNGSPTEEFAPSRGLRQGDPLSPLLFNLVGESLSCLLNIGVRNCIFSGISLFGGKEIITHLQFADDVILFLHNADASIIGIKRILQCFQLLSGMKVNFTKSHLYGFHIPQSRIDKWTSCLGCMSGKLPFSYLGATIGASPTSVKFWEPLLARLRKKLGNFEATCISMAGRLILLKAALDSAPIYWLSLYKLPTSVLNSLERMRRSFLWGDTPVHKKLHLLNWERVCKSKANGGLGLSSIKLQNSILLAKWWWRAYSERGSFWNRIFVGCYGNLWSFDLKSLNPKRCSPIVRSILSITKERNLQSVFDRSNFKWICGDGLKILFWEDVWVFEQSLADRFPTLYGKSTKQYSSVASLLDFFRTSPRCNTLWSSPLDVTQLRNLDTLVSMISSVSLNGRVDRICWLPSGSVFSTVLARKYLCDEPSTNMLNAAMWNKVWQLKAPPKTILFLWKLVGGFLPTNLLLSQRLHDFNPQCRWCTNAPESITHIFWECDLARWTWSYVQSWWSIKEVHFSKFGFNLCYILSLFKPKFIKCIWELVVVAALWSIWLGRNELIFNNVRISKNNLQDLIFFRVSKWGNASKLILFDHVPVWRVNPVGTIHVYHHLDKSNYWEIRRNNFHVICMVDAAWGLSDWGDSRGGIGGLIRNNVGHNLYVFSGPSKALSILEAEVEAILHALITVKLLSLKHLKVVVCSDSASAINIIYEGVGRTFPLLESGFDYQTMLHDSVCLNYVPSIINDEADLLAKQGINKTHFFNHWANRDFYVGRPTSE